MQIQQARAVARDADELMLAVPRLASISMEERAASSTTGAASDGHRKLCLVFLDLLAEIKFSMVLSPGKETAPPPPPPPPSRGGQACRVFACLATLPCDDLGFLVQGTLCSHHKNHPPPPPPPQRIFDLETNRMLLYQFWTISRSGGCAPACPIPVGDILCASFWLDSCDLA